MLVYLSPSSSSFVDGESRSYPPFECGAAPDQNRWHILTAVGVYYYINLVEELRDREFTKKTTVAGRKRREPTKDISCRRHDGTTESGLMSPRKGSRNNRCSQ